MMRAPMRYVLPCCARDTTGQAKVPPNPATNRRRSISLPLSCADFVGWYRNTRAGYWRMARGRSTRLVHLKPSRLHDRNPYLHFADQELGKVVRCSAMGIEADPPDCSDDLRRLQAFIDRGVDAPHRVGRRAGGGEQSV